MKFAAPLTLGLLTAGTLIAARQQPPAFHARTDVIAVDVQVVDRNGRPATGLGADKFEVTIDGKRRRVVSVDFIDYRAVASTNAAVTMPAGGAPTATAAPATTNPPSGEPVESPGRIVILAIDAMNFSTGDMRGSMVAARNFINGLPPGDQVGLFTYPYGPKINPTLDRDAVSRALDKVTGQRDSIAAEGEFHLRPSELIDLAYCFGTSSTQCEDLIMAGVSDTSDPTCRPRLAIYVNTAAMEGEGRALAGIGMLQSLFTIRPMPGRKTVVLVSGARAERSAGRQARRRRYRHAGGPRGGAGQRVADTPSSTALPNCRSARRRGARITR